MFMGSFGQNLKALMARDRVNASTVAKAIGEPAKTVQEWIGAPARTPRSLEVIPKLASYFKVSTHFILTGEEDPRDSLGVFLEKTEIHSGLYEISIKKVQSK